MWRMVKDRCRVIDVTFDERNRTVIDRAKLEAALFDPAGSVDPAPFRALLSSSAMNSANGNLT